ncbi:SIR2 family NAD-dependent protein deacylase [Azohydromonas caseinilytica]|uniref:NAD-dependent protein deacylase n=1 Tax=Azohydromonas caseinilytica TaxID=2728836 RepID=A0A848F7H6_9BURK|nr:NAD-dependent deacylase [Azohydromonas caseinilytica]NML14509.1 NAD-dependent deacylase [Azohydromonas caseinilytica]
MSLMDPTTARDIEDLRERLRAARKLCVLTGAGMSAESGIPTFRDAQTGYWSHLDPMQLASEAGFRADPRLVWDWYAERRKGVREALPNAGHRALAGYARRHPRRLTLVTQNVDDLHQRAGNRDTLRLHGDLLLDRWLERCAHQPVLTDTAGAVPGRPPKCPSCGNLVRPGVVWFGEMLPEGVLQAAERAAFECDVLLVIGTSGAVWPAAGLAQVAREAGGHVAILNPQPSAIDDQAHLCLRGTAAGVLPGVLEGV